MNKTLKKIFFGILLISAKLSSQEFYVNGLTINPGAVIPSNIVFKLNVSNNSETSESFCQLPSSSSEVYTDIAIDQYGNSYYVTNSGLLYKKNGNGSGCQFLGDFSYGGINSLAIDSGNFLYAIGGQSNQLYRYDIASGVFSDLGNIPANESAGGDLFFYENRLFLTTANGLLEINMVDPSQSCPFMNIQLPSLYAAFSIDYGTYSKAYIISGNNNWSSTLYEVDMVNKVLSDPIRTYNYPIYGAASVYNLTSTNSTCSLTPLSVQETNTSNKFFNVINPAKNTIICKTNIDRKEITQIRMFDNSGRLIKDFSNQNNIENLDISNFPDGIYLLTIATKNREKYTKKIIIKS